MQSRSQVFRPRGAEKILGGGRIAATQTRSKLNGETKHVHTGGSISSIYRLSQSEHTNSKRLIYIATSKNYKVYTMIIGILPIVWVFHFTKNCSNEIFLVRLSPKSN